MASGDTINGMMGSGTGAKNQWTMDDYSAGKLKTDPFSWGVTGKGVEGQDWGNTNNWTGQQWVDFNNQYNAKPADAAPADPGAMTQQPSISTPESPTGQQVYNASGSAQPTTGTSQSSTTATVNSTPPNEGWGGTTQVNIATNSNPNDPNNVMTQLLLDRAKQDTAVSADDPTIKGQVDAYSAAQDRARRNYLADAAESNSPYATGKMDLEKRMTAEQAGQNTAQFQADAMEKELAARRQQQQYYTGVAQNDTLQRYQTATQNAQFFGQLAQQKDIAGMQNMLAKSQLAQQDKEFLLSLAQQGKFQDAENEFKKMQLAQDQNQFVAKLAQTGQIAQMDDMFRRMQLAQEQSQFLDRLGFDTTQQQNYWDWKQRGNE